jgi:ABC-type lipoprotein export system ATPase subunit
LDISIRFYRNLQSADLKLEDGKVNFIIGPCGSGKSSVIDAISAPARPIDTTVGHTADETHVLVNGQQPNYSTARKYGVDQQQTLLSVAPNEDGYRVFIGNADELEDLENSFDSELTALHNSLGSLYVFRGRVDELVKNFGKPKARGYTPKSKLGKAETALSTSTASIRNTLSLGGTERIEWQINGLRFTHLTPGESCPFCGQAMDEDVCSMLRELDSAQLKDLKPFFKATPLLDDLGIERPNLANPDEAEKFKQNVIELYNIRNEVQKVIDFANLSAHVSTLQQIPKGLHVNDAVYAQFPELKPIVNSINDKADRLEELAGKMRGAFSKLIGSNANSLNRQLRMLGIPYELSVDKTDQEGKKASYLLKHVDSSADTDMRDSISYGERNLLSLLLFLHNEEDGVILIDDPASSYDDFRRSQIYDCIMKQGGKTTVVVSHDHAFVRRAVMDRSDRVGSILFIYQAGGKVHVMPVTKDSFVYLDDEIKRRIKVSTTYTQRMLNVRLYFDLHRNLSPLGWQYSSAVLHHTPKQAVLDLLSESNTDEQTVLTEMEQALGDDVKLEPIQAKYDTPISNEMTDFETLVYARELLSEPSTKGHLDIRQQGELEMLNDLVHMNDCMLFTLNPYQYPIWSPELHDLIGPCRQLHMH